MQKKKKGEKESTQKTNGHGKHGEKKGKQEVQLLNNLNYQQIPLPCLRNKTKTRQKLNENNWEKSKSRKVNRNSAGLCTNE